MPQTVNVLKRKRIKIRLIWLASGDLGGVIPAFFILGQIGRIMEYNRYNFAKLLILHDYNGYNAYNGNNTIYRGMGKIGRIILFHKTLIP